MNNFHKFGNRTAIVTGGTKNIGLAITKALLKVGLRVAILSSKRESLDFCLKMLAEYKNLSGHLLDLHKIELYEGVLSEVYSRFGSIDIIVNCAGLLDLSSIEKTQEQVWDDVMEVNLKAPFFLVQKSLPYLLKGSHPRVINLSSNAGRMGGFANGLSYSASKGGLIALTYGLARQLAKYNITVNCIAPGTIQSDMLAARDKDTIDSLLSRFPLGRFGSPEEVANAVLYFASQESGFTTGAVLDVNGGLFMG